MVVGRQAQANATVKVHVGDRRAVATTPDDGSLNTLDTVLWLAIRPAFEALRNVHLTDCRVSVLDTESATRAVTQVFLDTSNSERSRSRSVCRITLSRCRGRRWSTRSCSA
jgi:2-isopropylmalate synthase